MSTASFDVYREITRALTFAAPLQRDPRKPLLEPAAGAGHEAVRLDLGTPDRPIPGVWLRPVGPVGPTVVYVHGASTPDLASNAPLFEALLGRRIGVIAFDMPGYGANPGAFEEAALLAAVDQALGAVRARPDLDRERLGVYGLSMGGALTLRVAPAHPWMRALVLFGTPLALAVGARERLMEMLGTFHPLVTPMLLSSPTGHVARCFFEPVRFADGAAETMFDPGFVPRIDALVRRLDAIGAAADVPPVPTRLLVGAWDSLVPPADVRRLAGALRGPTDVIEYPLRNHATLLYDREAAEAAADWYERHL